MPDLQSCLHANHPCSQCPPHFRSLHVLCPTQAHPSQQHSIYLQGQILSQPLWAHRATAARASIVLLAGSRDLWQACLVSRGVVLLRQCCAVPAALRPWCAVTNGNTQPSHLLNSLETAPSFQWNCPSVQAPESGIWLPLSQGHNCLVLATITLSNHFLIRLQYNWPGDPSAAPNTTGRMLQETLKKSRTQAGSAI